MKIKILQAKKKQHTQTALKCPKYYEGKILLQ